MAEQAGTSTACTDGYDDVDGGPRGATGTVRPAALEPPVLADCIRLYRGVGLATVSTLPQWVATTPAYQAAAVAQGRWFTHSRVAAADYMGGARFGGAGVPRLRYVDLPVDVAARWALANTANRDLDTARTHSAAWGEEYFLPRELAGMAADLEPPAGSDASKTSTEPAHPKERTSLTMPSTAFRARAAPRPRGSSDRKPPRPPRGRRGEGREEPRR
jgi:hypothetical protein